MSDIRINALATTATASASDDYVAIDGSANGTRKLNAYSPTFGGNLTVSGTGTSSFAGNVAVTGTGTNYTAIDTGSFVKFGNNQTSSNLQVGAQGFGGVIQGAQSGSAAYNILAQPYGGNFLVGTTSDTGYRVHVVGANDAQMMLDVASGSQYTSLAFANSGSGKGFVYWDNTNNGLFAGTYASNASLKFNTGLGVLALTLDSSQNATFAGNITAKGTTYYFGADNSQRIELTSNNGSSQGLVEFYNRGTSAYFAARYLASSHTFEQGPIAINNTVQTAAGVSSTHKVTISIGGTTYYLLATNV